VRRRGLRGPLPWLGALLVAYLVLPVAAFAGRVAGGADRGFGAVGLWPAVGVSVETATISLLLTTVLGIPLAHVLATHRGRLAAFVGVVVQLPLALPPLMSGILLIFVIGPYTTLGRIFDGRLTESLAGIVIAQSFVSAPFLVIAARSAFAAVDPALRDVAATLGHRELARFFRVDIRSAAPAIRAGMVLAWLRAFGEYGANVIVAYHPFSLPIYTDNQFQTYPLSTSEAPTLLALAAAAVVVALGQGRLPTRLRSRLQRCEPPPPRAPGPAAPTAVGFDLHARVGTFSLDIVHRARGSRLAVVGPSGSGKSVTLRAVAGLLGPGAGQVTYAGVEVARVAPENRRVGYLPQGLGLVPGLTVWQQVLFGVHADPALAAWWVATLYLDELLDRYPHQLSGGQRQRVGLARALACSPEVVLLDEPFSALDAPVRDELRRELRRLQHQTGLSTVVVTHDPEEAALLADDILVISDGAVLQSGSVGEVYRRPASEQVARLLGIDNVRSGVVAADGTVRCGSVLIDVASDAAPGSDVLWRVPAELVRIGPLEGAARGPGSYEAVVQDVVDLGASVEVTVALDRGPWLRSRNSGQVDLVIADACVVQLDTATVTVWRADRPGPH
jgi:ABC-type sulfate/molybdate transport systems ATPase subunit/ABC-type sulfate transport system permease component